MCFSIAEGLRGGRGARDTIPSSGESGFQMEPGWKTSPSLAEARPENQAGTSRAECRLQTEGESSASECKAKLGCLQLEGGRMRPQHPEENGRTRAGPIPFGFRFPSERGECAS